MVRFLKRALVTAGILAGLIIGGVVLIPMFVDVGKYLPNIEPMVTRQTGRSFSMGDDIKLSLFPWAGIRLSDLTLGNPEGFEKNPMISVKSFEVRVKVLPLFSKQIEVDKFIVDSPSLILVKNKTGVGNWEHIGAADSITPDQKNQTQPSQESSGAPGTTSTELPIKSFAVDRFDIVNGFLSYEDRGTGLSKKISDLNINLSRISMDKSIAVAFGAKVDGKPVSLTGTVGPVGQNPGAEDIDFDVMAKALDQLTVFLRGRLIKPITEQKIDLTVDLMPFSPKKLFAALDQSVPIESADVSVLDKLSLKALVKGSAKAVTVSNGVLVLDDSTINFSARAQAFEKPDLKFVISLDKIDVDRYLPPAEEKDADGKMSAGDEAGSTGKNTDKDDSKSSTIDYTPLRRMMLDAKVNIGSLKVSGLTMGNITGVLAGKNGVFTLDPFSMDLYQGRAGATARVDVRKNTPTSTLHLTTSAVQAGPVIRDSTGKDIIEGAMAADIALSMTGDTPDMIKKTLDGEGELNFIDGAIVGVDIARNIRNTKADIDLKEPTTEKPRTDFDELKIPYMATKGLLNIQDASLVSPLLRLVASGETSLVKEDLNFRIEPKLVATLKGQGDTTDRSGLLIPLVITGTWEEPKVTLDLEAIMKNRLPDADDIKQILKGDGSGDIKKSDVEDAANELIKGLLK